MLTQVQAALDRISGMATTLQNANGAGRAFELFVMTGLAVRLPSMGFEVWLQRSDGSRILPTDPDRRFIQRGGKPTGIAPAAQGAGNSGSIAFRHGPGGTVWEIWNGILFTGRSGADHEIDVAIVPKETGDTLRLTGGSPLGRPKVSIECKDVGTAGSVDEMRAFVARMYDLTYLDGHAPFLPYPAPPKFIHPGPPAHAGSSNEPGSTFRNANSRAFNAIARRTGFSSGAGRMTGYYFVRPYGGVLAGSVAAGTMLDEAADWVAANCL